MRLLGVNPPEVRAESLHRSLGIAPMSSMLLAPNIRRPDLRRAARAGGYIGGSPMAGTRWLESGEGC